MQLMNNNLLIFGASKLQRSIIELAKKMGFFTIAIDPDPLAECRFIVDVYKVVKGDDYDGTLALAEKFNISALVTAATDKPLVMMARIATALNLPFYSVETAQISTDKLLMKDAFLKGGISCAKGKPVSSINDFTDFTFPVILKPRDNSGSRGVVFCNSISEANSYFSEVKKYTNKDTILVEEFIGGKEYSIESLHFDGKSEVVQYTEKITTPLPYNVELGHIQPADLSIEIKKDIANIISKIGIALGFENCASHTELKINERGIFVIETSPRLGGDFITSKLVPLSTGINIEEQLLNIASRKTVNLIVQKNRYSAVSFFDLSKNNINVEKLKNNIESLKDSISSFELYYSEYNNLPVVTNSLERHGHVIFSADTQHEFQLIQNQLQNEF